MCTNIIVLYVFIILKIIAAVILPIAIFFLRKKDFVKYIIGTDICLLAVFFICSAFNINKCVYNSNPEGIKRTKIENKIAVYNEIHPERILPGENELEPEGSYKTYTGKTFYYYNQNNESLKNFYFECKNQKVYFNTFGSSITAFSSAVSTLYNRNINPIRIYNIYKDYNISMCDATFDINDLYRTFMNQYGSIKLSQISVSQVEQSIRDGGIVIAELSATENSKLTCDSDYIVIYNIGLDGKFMIADPALSKKPYVCAYSSEAYGNVIDSENMNKSWDLDDIDEEAIRYYLLRK